MSTSLIGTSGYFYDWWFTPRSSTERFYPVSVNKSTALKYYSSQFNFVEINSSFYKLPSVSTIKNWKNQTPDNFKFLVKFSRYATHNKKLNDFPELFDNFWFNRIELLGEKCVGIIMQFGPKFINNKNKSKIDNLTMLQRIKKAGKYINKLNNDKIPDIYIEFRHKSWYNEEVYSILKKYNFSLVCNHHNCVEELGGNPGFNPPLEELPITLINKIMFRCHGTWNIAYQGGYQQETLDQISDWIKDHTNNEGIIKDSIIAFNNTDSFEGSYELFGGGVIPFPTEKLLPHAINDAYKMIATF